MESSKRLYENIRLSVRRLPQHVVASTVARRLLKLLTFIISLILFVAGILYMKDGARSLAPVLTQYIQLDSPLTGFSAGWLASMVIMSGSPIAAASLAFLDAGILSPLSTFTMIMGSRFGASFIVLGIGFVYTLRGRDLLTGLGMGLLSFGVTISLHVLGIIPGIWMVQSEVFASVPRPAGAIFNNGIDNTFGVVSAGLTTYLPTWSLFIVGLVVIMASFALFDRCLPTQTLKESEVGMMARYVYRPSVMFALGMIVTLISMSVSLSISILVPLSDRGLVRRENVMPYIMGANVTTFVDTLLAAVLMTSPAAFDVVLAEMVSITLAALFVLVFFFRQYEHIMEVFVEWVTARPRNLFIFLFLLFAIPIAGIIVRV